MTTFASLDQMAVGFLTWLEGWAVNQHQKTDDEGFAAVARLAGKVGALIAAPESAADIAAIKKMAVQDLPSLAAAPAAPAPAPAAAPAPKSPSFDRGDHAHGSLMDPSS